MNKKKTLLLTSLLAVAGYNVSAQAPAIEWDKTYGGSGRDEIACMTISHEGGYIFAGLSESGISGEKTQASRGAIDIWIVRTDANGNILNERTIGGSEADNPTSIARTADGGYIVLANSTSGATGDKDDTAKGRAGRGSAPEADLWVIKLNNTIDTIQWQKTIGGNTTDRPASIIPTSDGGYIVGAYSRSQIYGDKTIDRLTGTASTTYDYWVLKLNSTGTIQWQKVVGGIKDDNMSALVATNDGGFIAGGYYSSGSAGDPPSFDYTDTSRGGNDYSVVKFDANGTIQWTRLIGGNNADVLSGIIQTSDGGYLLTGGSESEISGDKTEDFMSRNTKDYWIVKLDKNGVQEWDRVYGGTDIDDYPTAVETTEGSFVIAGESSSRADAVYTNKLTEKDGRHLWIIKIDQLGNKIWEKSVGPDSSVKYGAMMLAPDGGYIIGGYTAKGIGGDKTEATRGGADFWIVKLAKDCTSDTTKTYLDASFCKGSDYSLPSGTVVTTPGIHYDTLISSSNCDSILVINLSENVVDVTVNVSNGTLTAAAQGATYQWINCATNQPISGATSASYTPTASGNYAVVVTANGCSDTSDCQEVIPTSVHELSAEEMVHIYPNPASSTIQVNAPFNVSLTVMTLDGRVILSQNNAKTLNVGELAEGIYLLRAVNAAGVVVLTEKLTIVK